MWTLQMTMPSIKELPDNEDCMPINTLRYFNKDNVFSKNLSEMEMEMEMEAQTGKLSGFQLLQQMVLARITSQ
jgi:hypothetical protein